MEPSLDLWRRNPFSSPFQQTQTASCEPNGNGSMSQSLPPCQKMPGFRSRSPGPIQARNIAFASMAEDYWTEYGSPAYYSLCGVGGALCCCITHIVTLPLDLVKCRMQVDAVKYPSLIAGAKIALRQDGLRGLFKGWSPTVIGYSAQGACKFGLYEVFKKEFAEMVGPYNAYYYRAGVYLAAAFTAEAIGDVFLSPFESIKVRMQTQPGFVSSMREAIPIIISQEGIYGFYRSLVPLWGRQIPYTVVKFVTFERTVELIYKHVVPKPRSEISKPEQLVVTFTAGYIAGVFCAVVSHPGDTLVSKLQEKGTSMSSVYAQIGWRGLWAGLGPRILMIGTIAASQWLIYDAFKVAVHIPRPPPPEPPRDR